MKVRAIFCALFFFPGAVAATGIPDVVSVGTYSISARLEGMWAVEVFEKAQIIRYSYAGTEGRRSQIFQLSVYRIGVPTDKVSLDTAELVRQLVARDGLNFMRTEFGGPVQFRFKPDRVDCPAWSAYVYVSEPPASRTPAGRFGAVALLLPQDYRTRKIGYLLVGHEIESTKPPTREQVAYLKLILQGLKEAANQQE